jgi:hypothetical protein
MLPFVAAKHLIPHYPLLPVSRWQAVQQTPPAFAGFADLFSSTLFPFL